MIVAGGRVVLLLLFLLSGASVSGAESSTEKFQRARQLAFDGQREEARELCQAILDGNPDYWDARVLLGRLYAWDKRYDEARRELTRVVEAKPEYADPRNALIDVEIWSHHPDAALKLADEGLAADPDNAQFEFARARALAQMKLYEESADAAEKTLVLDPDHEAAKRLLRRVYDILLGDRVGVVYDYEDFADDTASWHLLELQYRRAYGFGTMIYRLNLARRFDENGAQVEVDAYPKIRAGTYLYLNLGLSGSDLFPDVRTGAEVYEAFGGGWEASLGFRFLDFDSNDVWIYTGSVAKYHGNHWIQFRPGYVSDDAGSSYSGEIQYRRYFGGRYEWAGLTVGGGFDNELNLPTRQQDELDSFRIRADLRKKIANKVLLRATVGYREQELGFGVTRESWFLSLGFDRFF
jgi:YaiO family outer membrane protein